MLNDNTGYYTDRSVSNSSLSLINPSQMGNPSKFKAYLDGRIETKKKLNLQTGSIIHAMVEAPDDFAVSEVSLPNDNLMRVYNEYLNIKDTYFELSLDELLIKASRLAKFYNNRKDESLLKALNESSLKDYISEMESLNGKHIVTKEQKEIILSCIKSLQSHEGCYTKLFQVEDNAICYKELEIFWECEELDENGEPIKCKAKLDVLKEFPDERRLELIDLKTGQKSAQFFKESFDFWRYGRQLSYYKSALLSLEKYKGWKLDTFMPVVSTTDFTRHCYSIPNHYLMEGEDEWRALLKRISFHKKNNEWNYTMEECLSGNYIISL